MAQITTKSTGADDSDFAAHLQRRFGVTSHELGECLTQYRPSRPYPILLSSEAQQGAQGGDSSGR
jgi:hypothetical protein